MSDAQTRPAVDCRGLWKIFGTRAPEAMEAVRTRGLGKTEILKEFGCVIGVADASIQVAPGEIFCIMGLSGSGKSTLIRMLNRLIDPTAGTVRIKGEEIGGLDPRRLRAMRAEHIGMVFQSVALLPHRTVLENAAFGLEVRGVPKAEREKAARDALARVSLGDWTGHHPDALSGGMQQRVGLARALAADPEIILMDEPFSALDPLIRRRLQDEFRALAKALGKSVVFITHDLDEAIRIGDRIAIMKDGAIIQTGTAEQIALNPADAYVADFVGGLSPLHLIKAHSVMTPPEGDHAALPRTGPEADIDALIALMTARDAQALAVEQDGETIGIVTIHNLLRGVRGAAPEAPQAGGPGHG